VGLIHPALRVKCVIQGGFSMVDVGDDGNVAERFRFKGLHRTRRFVRVRGVNTQSMGRQHAGTFPSLVAALPGHEPGV
jgi:hypothetical protein